MRDPLHPFVYAAPIAAGIRRLPTNSGSTHSVDVDFNGVAWVSGTGGVRGWWTEGTHKDTSVTPAVDRVATPYDPISYAGGQITGNESSIMHNSYHFPTAVGDQPAGDVLLVTNENNNTSCANAGKFLIASLSGTYDADLAAGAAPKMARLASYGTSGKPGEFHGTVGTTTVGDCSAHWSRSRARSSRSATTSRASGSSTSRTRATRSRSAAFRVPARAADATNPEIISSDTSAAYWHGKYVYVSDYQRPRRKWL